MDELRLDGNGAAGELREIFVTDITSARVSCGGCGRVEPVGAQHAYVRAPGVVLRCCHCDEVLLVLTRGPGTHVLGVQGARWLEISDAG